MSEFILREEPFSLGILDRVPKPNDGECILLYQAGGEKKGSLVMNSGVRYSSAEVRHGRYNQKVTISLSTKSISHNQRVVMKDHDFYFDVTVKLSYSLQDVREYFFNERMEEEDVHNILRNIVRRYDGEWDIQQSWKAQSELEDAVTQKLTSYEGIKFRIQQVNVVPDAAAEKMLQSNRDKTVGIHVTQNETDEKIAKNVQDQRVLDSEYELKLKKMKDMALMMKNFGSLGPIVNEYLQGRMDGTELYDYIMRAKTNDMSILTTAVDNDLLTQKEAFEKLEEILGDARFQQMDEQRQLVNKGQGRIEDEEKREDGVESIPLADGDCI